MNAAYRVRRALLSVTDKTGLAELGRALVERGVTLVASGGTAAHLQSAGLAVVSVESLTRSPEILGGRVKTLHPLLHAGLLADRGQPSHVADLEALGVEPIDLVVVNFYAFERAAAESALPIEAIDIGGPTLVRAAAKNFAWVSVLTDPGDYGEFLAAWREDRVDLDLRRHFAARAFERVARYDRAIADRFERAVSPAAACGRWPATWGRSRMKLGLELRYGENPHQSATAYRDEPAWGLGAITLLAGAELSYNNLLDTDAALDLVFDLGEAPACAIVKHANPCGAARGATAAEAWRAALACDPVSAFGGIAAFNVPVDAEAAEALAGTFLEVLCAPRVLPEALARLATAKKKLRILEVPRRAWRSQSAPYAERELHGVLLVQERDSGLGEVAALEVVTRRAPTADERRDLEFLLAVCKHVRSNAIVLGRGERTLGIGAGQMSRVDSCELAVRKARAAGHDLAGSVAVSDAFFPFADGVERLVEAGVSAILQPGGSKRDPEVIEAADRAGIAMMLSHRRHFRH
jgi:phosphoribosylaminoimidazolecarboxamide formyltransferase/IMP cyclohydrolase